MTDKWIETILAHLQKDNRFQQDNKSKDDYRMRARL
jgi:hypothetical protein